MPACTTQPEARTPSGPASDESPGSETTPASSHEGGIADMPYLPLRLEATSVRFQRVWRLSVAASETPLEAPSDEASPAELRRWMSDVLVPWIQVRTEIIEACRVELRALRGGERDEHLVGAALLGYLYEDTALQLRGVRLPVAGVPYGSVRAAPPERIEALQERARRAFERCQLAGLGAIEVTAWRQYCLEASERLGPSSQPVLDDGRDRDEVP